MINHDRSTRAYGQARLAGAEPPPLAAVEMHAMTLPSNPIGVSMTNRARQLQSTADRQVGGLIALLSTVEPAALRSPCPGREKLGDGTIAASVKHTADNYQRIAEFVTTSDRSSASHAPTQAGRHRIPRFLQAIRHAPGRSQGPPHSLAP